VLGLAACDQEPPSGPEASWTGSIGRLVVEGGYEDSARFLAIDDAEPEHGRMTRVSVDHPTFDKALRLETLIQPFEMKSLQARVVTTGDIPKDAACWLHIEGRATQPQAELGLGRLAIAVQAKEEDLPPFLDHAVYLEPAWTAIDLSFVAPSAFDAGEVEIVFGVGTQLQVLDLGDMSMRCFDEKSALPGLPKTAFSYAGREANAAWRTRASNQIERYRKGDLVIDVTDSNGQPIPDAEIHIQMTRHAFKFGASIEAKRLLDVGGDTDQTTNTASFRKNLGELFNTVTFKESLRWTRFEDPSERQTTEEALDWARSLGLELRGRGLAFSDIADLPTSLQDQIDQPQLIKDAIRKGVAATASELGGRISVWEVIDPSRSHLELLGLVGEDELGSWFGLAREAHAEAKLALSERDLLAGDGMAGLADLIAHFVDQDVPIDQIGAYGRFETQPPPIDRLNDRLDQLASFDLPLVITAFNMVSDDQALQLDFTRDFLTLAFSHPSVEGVIFEQFQKSEAQETGAELYRQDGAISPIGQMYRDLVLRRWWSDVVASSDEDGQVVSRVFQGDYTITARKGDQRATVMLTIGPEGAAAALELALTSESEQTL